MKDQQKLKFLYLAVERAAQHVAEFPGVLGHERELAEAFQALDASLWALQDYIWADDSAALDAKGGGA